MAQRVKRETKGMIEAPLGVINEDEMVNAVSEVSFEVGLENLESLVRRMETESLTLEESMSIYMDGIRLARLLDGQLDRTEKKLTMLSSASTDDMGGETVERAEAL